MFSKVSLVCLLVCVAAIVPTASADDHSSTRLVLSVDEGAPGADAMLSGDYVAAVAAVKRVDPRSKDVSAQHTLCAAYVAQSKLEQAEVACDNALQLAGSMITTARYPHGHKDRQALGKAFSNRAVLRLLQGDKQAAKADLAAARKHGDRQDRIRQTESLVETNNSIAGITDR